MASQSNYTDIGSAGEDLVVEWLQSNGWKILHRRWRCRRGEIDIVAQKDDPGEFAYSCASPTLAFVEVKTRSAGNWDAGGRSAITAQKRTKLWYTAQMFIARYPQAADYSCRFDVALVYCQRSPQSTTVPALLTSSVKDQRLMLVEYIPAAFDS